MGIGRRNSGLSALDPPGRDFEAFYRAHYEEVARYVARRTPSSSRDEVVAQTFIVAWRKFSAAPSPSLAWLYRIASHEVAHELRRLARHRTVDGVDLGSATHVASPLDQTLVEALSELSRSDVEILRLVHWEQLSRAEIASMLRLSIGTVNVRYHRATQRLEDALRRRGHTFAKAVSHTKENQ